jgi:hypothetical protein
MVINVAITILPDFNLSEGSGIEVQSEHSGMKLIFSLFRYLCAPGTEDLLVLSWSHCLEQLLFLDAVHLSDVVTDTQREDHAERLDGYLNALHSIRTQVRDIPK